VTARNYGTEAIFLRRITSCGLRILSTDIRRPIIHIYDVKYALWNSSAFQRFVMHSALLNNILATRKINWKNG
jgi:hypothetical protein